MKIRTAVILALVTLSPLAGGQAQISNPLKFTLFGGGALPDGHDVGPRQNRLHRGGRASSQSCR